MTIIFYFPQYKELAQSLSMQTGLELGDAIFRNFPEGESYVKINSAVKNKKIILVCGLENADEKIMSIMFFSKTAKELGAKEVGLVAPYLGYMRMDKRFQDGEAITSNIFAEFLSKQIDWLMTIDPHLHRHKNLAEIYSIPCKTITATKAIAAWVQGNVENPLLIGPDEESEQWVKEIAIKCSAPFIVLKKIRLGDAEVKVSMPPIEQYQGCTPVLIDDIISTAQTMIETIKNLQNFQEKPICIGVHAIFVGDAYEELKNAGAQKIVTCNTIKHFSNVIDVMPLISDGLIS